MNLNSRKTMDMNLKKVALVSIVLAIGISLSLIYLYKYVLGFNVITPLVAILLLLIGMAASGTLAVYFMPLREIPSHQHGIRYSLLKITLTALILTLVTLSSDYIFSLPTMHLYSNLGFLTLFFGSVLSAILIMLGLVFVVIRQPASGFKAGVLGFVLEAFILATWWLLGAPWIP